MREQDYTIAKQLRERLSESIPLVDFRVFGSRARDTADEHSDMDVFIEVASLDGSMKERIFDLVWEVGFQNYVLISPLVFTKEEIEKSPLRSSPIVRNIMEEGVKV
jgi:predicted nucleotidyltransferase